MIFTVLETFLPTFKVAGLNGWPFFQYWVEYPPLFPFLNAALYRLASGQEFLYDFCLLMLVTLAGAGCLFLFLRMARSLFGERGGWLRTVLFFGVLAPLPYTWWYYDLIPLLFTLLALFWLLEKKEGRSAISLGLGILTKWFPVFLLPAAWRYWPWRNALRATLVSIGITAAVVGGLYLASPKMTTASLLSQPGRTSWETSWALLDGNYDTGEFILLQERYDPTLYRAHQGNPPKVPSWLTLPIFAALGLGFFWKVKVFDRRSMISFVGITWVLFLLWSPGWSPQWVLYLLPLILLSLPEERAFTITLLLVLITVLEWPFLLAHHIYAGLWVVIPARVGLFAWLIYLWYRQTVSAL